MPRAVLAAAILLSACSSPHRLPPEGQPVGYRAHLEPVVLDRCLSCHTFEEPKAELVLEAGTGYGELVGPRSVQVPESLLVVPGDPESSYLWLKLDDRAAVGDGMPRTLFGYKRLPEKEMELFRRWIADGALP